MGLSERKLRLRGRPVMFIHFYYSKCVGGVSSNNAWLPCQCIEISRTEATCITVRPPLALNSPYILVDLNSHFTWQISALRTLLEYLRIWFLSVRKFSPIRSYHIPQNSLNLILKYRKTSTMYRNHRY